MTAKPAEIQPQAQIDPDRFAAKPTSRNRDSPLDLGRALIISSLQQEQENEKIGNYRGVPDDRVDGNNPCRGIPCNGRSRHPGIWRRRESGCQPGRLAWPRRRSLASPWRRSLLPWAWL